MAIISAFATVLGLSTLLLILHPQAMFSAIDTGRPEYFSLGDKDENLVSYSLFLSLYKQQNNTVVKTVISGASLSFHYF